MVPKIVCFVLSDFLGNDECFHLSKNRIAHDTDIAHHRHDYYEVFWVIEGGCNHWVNGKRTRLDRGKIIFMRPHDAHYFTFDNPDQQLLIYNIAISQTDVAGFGERYLPNGSALFWSMEPLPEMRKLTEAQLQILSENAQSTLEKPRHPFYLDRLFLHILHQLCFSTHRNVALPHWLDHVVREFTAQGSEPLLREGATAFLQRCKRTNTHVNRTLQQYYGQNLTQWLNQTRMARAREALGITNKGVKEIAYDVGINDVNYFYKLFKNTYGISPKAFRERNSSIF